MEKRKKLPFEAITLLWFQSSFFCNITKYSEKNTDQWKMLSLVIKNNKVWLPIKRLYHQISVAYQMNVAVGKFQEIYKRS